MAWPRVLAVLLLLVAPTTGAEEPCRPDSREHVHTCSSTPDGRAGHYVSTPVGFAFVVDGGAGAGSLAGAVASWSTSRVTVAVYGRALVAVDAVVVGVSPRDADADGRPDAATVDVAMPHRGAPWDFESGASVTAWDGKRDGVPERVRVVGGGPYWGADAEPVDGRARLALVGYPVVLAP